MSQVSGITSEQLYEKMNSGEKIIIFDVRDKEE